MTHRQVCRRSACLLFVVSGAFAARAAEPPLAVTDILAAVGQVDAAKLRTARTAFGKPEAGKALDVRTTLAFALALIQNERYAEAAKALDRLSESQRRSTTVRRVQTFLAVQLDQQDRIRAFADALLHSVLDKDSKATLADRQQTVRLLAGLLTLADGASEPPPAAWQDAAGRLPAELPAELAEVYQAESARVRALKEQRQAADHAADDAAAEAAQKEIALLAAECDKRQQNADAAESEFHKFQPKAIADLKKGRKRLKGLQNQLAALSNAKSSGARAPEQPKPTTDAKGRVTRYPSDSEILQYQRDVARWQEHERLRIQKNTQEIQQTNGQIGSVSAELDQLQSELNAKADELDLQKKDLKKLKGKLSNLKKLSGGHDEAFRPADFDILPLPAEKERILRSYER